ncbi:MAG: hypothetical protein IK095_01765 [Oscillospiraceae bacterium]|nr:hypothetical protein [Oscillospiraceae bacterium]
MKKKILAILCALLAILAIALIVLNVSFRKIAVVSGEQFVDKCPRYARPGQEVTITTAVVSDGEIYVNGVDGRYVRPGVYVFTMPDEDVAIKVTVIAFRDGA